MATGLIIIGTDSDKLAQAGKLLLEKKGYVIQTARRGQPLDRLLYATSPRLVMVDLRGLDLDFAMCRRARETVGHTVPIIAIITTPTIEQVHACLDAGASDLLVRLNDSNLFLGMVELWAVRGGRKIERPPMKRSEPDATEATCAKANQTAVPGSGQTSDLWRSETLTAAERGRHARGGSSDVDEGARSPAAGGGAEIADAAVPSAAAETEPGPLRDRSGDDLETALEEMTNFLRGNLLALARRHGMACDREMEIGYVNGVLDVWARAVPSIHSRSIVALEALLLALVRLDPNEFSDTLMRWGVLDERRRYRSGYQEGNLAARAYLEPGQDREEGGVLASVSLDEVRDLAEQRPGV